MKYFLIILPLIFSGCVLNKEEPNYLGVQPTYVILNGESYRVPPPPPTIYVPSAPSASLIIPAKPNFIPHMPEEAQNRLKMLLTKGQ